MAINIINYNGKQYADKQIESATGYQSATVVGDELPFDTLEADVWDYSTALLQYCTNDEIVLYQTQDGLWLYNQLTAEDLTVYTFGAPVTWTHKGNLIVSQFLKEVSRIGKYKFRLSCMSGVGLIAESRHYGGLYNGELFGTVLADVIGGGFPYTIDSQISSIPVYGWLPVATRRENLKDMLTSSGAVIRTGADGLPWFTAPVTDSPKSIADSAIYMGGSVEHPIQYKAVKITEHAYAQTPADLLMTLYDGAAIGEQIVTPMGATVTGVLVTFSDPMHDLDITGSTILESGVNYAVLSPSTSCQLTGYKYSHTQRIVTAGEQTATEEATKRIEDCTLINALNSEAVAQRWFAYYSAQKKVSMSVVWESEQPADTVQFSDPYDDAALGMIETLDVRMSNKIAADAVIQCGTILPIVGNYFQNVMVVTQSGTVTIPQECSGKIRVVLISGGYGGGSGLDGAQSVQSGTNGQQPSGDATQYYVTGEISAVALGGQPGTPGQGGKIYQITMPAQPGQQFSAVIGVGGAGGTRTDGTESNAGASGTATTFGGYTSEDGAPSETGYYDTINGVAYALPGGAGIAGGNGAGANEDNTAVVDAQGVSGFGQTFSGGSNNSQELYDEAGTASLGYGEKVATSKGGYGSGAAYGTNGNPGGAPVTATVTNTTATVEAGPGGIGADALPPPAATAPGSGGYGGNGGGGAGSAGQALAENYVAPGATGQAQLYITRPTSRGGYGSAGGQGAPGVILIYY